MKVGSKIVKVVLIILSFLIVLLIVCFINHRVNLSKEAKLFKPLGQMVTVKRTSNECLYRG